MKVKLLQDYRGVLTGEQFYRAGDHDLPDDVAKALIKAGRAITLDAPHPDKPTGAKRGLPGIDEKIAKALWDAGYKTLGDIAEAPDDDLLDISGIGPSRLAQIREALQ